MRDGCLPEDYYLIGDNVFTSNRNMITHGRDTGFSYELSKLRIIVECAFGDLVRHWGILWRPPEMNFNKRALAAVAVCTTTASIALDAELTGDYGSMEISAGRSMRLPRLER